MKTKTTSKKSDRTLQPEKWIELHHTYLLNFAVGRMPDVELARDIVQQTFMAAWKGRDSFRGDSTERTWLTTILRNKITDFYRARSRRPDLVDFSNASTDGEDAIERWVETNFADARFTEPDETAKRSEYLDEVFSAFSDLPAAAAQILKMRVFEGTSVKDISAKLGLTPGTVSTKICRARKQLRTAFGH